MGEINLIKLLESLLQTADGRVIYILTLISITMCIDFLTGTAAAYINPSIEFKSKAGINGILRKICSLLLMIIFVPFVIAVDKTIGLTIVWTLYLGYEIMELKSIAENIEKMGGDVSLFMGVLDILKEKINNKNKRGK